MPASSLLLFTIPLFAPVRVTFSNSNMGQMDNAVVNIRDPKTLTSPSNTKMTCLDFDSLLKWALSWSLALLS